MPSMKCHQCPTKSKPAMCRMYVDEHTGKIIYLCAPCARELGYLKS